MAKPKDSDIHQRLRRVVKDAIKNGENITLRIARSKVEADLGLEDGFLKNDAKWKVKSKDIITAAVAEVEEQEVAEPSVTAAGTKPVKAAESTDRKKKQKAKTQGLKIDAPSTPKAVFTSSKAPGSVVRKASVETKQAEADQSSEEESDSGTGEDESTDSEAEGHTQPSPKNSEREATQVNGVKRKAGSASASDSSSEESDGGEDRVEGEPKWKKAKTSSSSASQSSSSEEASSSADDGEDEEEEPQTNDSPSPLAEDAPVQRTFASVPTRQYEPPNGYMALESTILIANPNFFASNLSGKEIWHITLPSSLPLSSIPNIAIDALTSRTPILSHNGAEYILAEEPASHDLLIPTPEGYQKHHQTIACTIKIQQKITLPNLTARQADPLNGSSAAGNIAQAAVSTVPPQPKGLRMRYKPPGFGSGRPGRIGSGSESTTDSEEESAAPRKTAFQFPKALGAHATSVQQGLNAVLRESASKEVKKNHRKEKGENGRVGEGSASPIVASKKAPDVSSSATRLSNGDVPKESKEERAKRKEEKRLKKAAKAKAAA